MYRSAWRREGPGPAAPRSHARRPAHLTHATTGLLMRPPLSASTRLYSSRPASKGRQAAGAAWWSPSWPARGLAGDGQLRSGGTQVGAPGTLQAPLAPRTANLSEHHNHFDLRAAGAAAWQQSMHGSANTWGQPAHTHCSRPGAAAAAATQPRAAQLGSGGGTCLRDVLVAQAVVGERAAGERVAADRDAWRAAVLVGWFDRVID